MVCLTVYTIDFQSEILALLPPKSAESILNTSESICRLSWKVFADFGGNNTRISLCRIYPESVCEGVFVSLRYESYHMVSYSS